MSFREVFLQFSPAVPAPKHRLVVPAQRSGNHQSLVGETASHVLDGEQSLPRYERLVNAQHEPGRVQSEIEAHNAAKISGL
jgi:hypothetical protein